MARPLRVNIVDGWYHVMHRGIERRRIFDDARDHETFLDLLGETSERYRIRMHHAYCLLGNHYHAIVQTPDANLSEGMQWLGLAYSRLYNIRNNRVGPLFQGRFISGRCR
jgi:REP element-mobilizing transposase RayT